MEIDPAIYNQYRDTPFKPEDLNNNQINLKLGKKIKNPNMDEYINYMLENTKEQDHPKNIKNSYNIILTTSLDKIKSMNNVKNSLVNNNGNDEANLDTANACSKNDVTLNLKVPKIFNDEKDKEEYNEEENEEEDENGENNDNDVIKEEIKNNKNVDMLVEQEDYENNFGGINNMENYHYENQNKNEKFNKKYYNAFNENNAHGNNIPNNQNNLSKSIENKISNKKGKLPNIVLTNIYYPKNDITENEGRFSKFINLFSFKKKKNEENKESKRDVIQNPDKNDLPTLEQKIKYENKEININEKDFNKSNKKDDFALGKISSERDKINSNTDIKKLKSELSGNDDMNDDQNEDDIKEKSGNNKCFIIKAEPILNSDNKNDINNSSDEENKLGDSSQMIDIDKSSEYTLKTGTNIDFLIRKKSNFSPLLMGILLGSCALFYMLYKKIKFKEILGNVSQLVKQIPGFLEHIFSLLGAGFEDFMERYNDINRLFIGILCIISFWFIFKLLMKKIFQRNRNK